jgi:hypothetical protein
MAVQKFEQQEPNLNREYTQMLQKGKQFAVLLFAPVVLLCNLEGFVFLNLSFFLRPIVCLFVFLFWTLHCLFFFDLRFILDIALFILL